MILFQVLILSYSDESWSASSCWSQSYNFLFRSPSSSGVIESKSNQLPSWKIQVRSLLIHLSLVENIFIQDNWIWVPSEFPSSQWICLWKWSMERSHGSSCGRSSPWTGSIVFCCLERIYKVVRFFSKRPRLLPQPTAGILKSWSWERKLQSTECVLVVRISLALISHSFMLRTLSCGTRTALCLLFH
jgi:hypothetical protein